MSWDSKVKQWQNDEVTKAFTENLWEALAELHTKLIYAAPQDFQQLQGLARAYLDMLNIIDEGDITDPWKQLKDGE